MCSLAQSGPTQNVAQGHPQLHPNWRGGGSGEGVSMGGGDGILTGVRRLRVADGGLPEVGMGSSRQQGSSGSSHEVAHGSGTAVGGQTRSETQQRGSSPVNRTVTMIAPFRQHRWGKAEGKRRSRCREGGFYSRARWWGRVCTMLAYDRCSTRRQATMHMGLWPCVGAWSNV
jgi:hypothetical protein